ncbi:hypothetical protein QBC42DRAFT_60001 [Cladorrhinum samala]|uniref:Uncharacterized protein n=1 Tax=Cladorrhinum samala TaxID=585594 RepID=A0AAV9HVG5_9PEZI|nr:hypothetical protein QBC42DRAFT_60001 [Cladorrhinum samala]
MGMDWAGFPWLIHVGFLNPCFLQGFVGCAGGGGAAHRRRDGLMVSSPFCWDCPWDLTSQFKKIARGRPSSAAHLPTGQREAVDFLASKTGVRVASPRGRMARRLMG